jgi:predicted transposase YbfD/YdcC
MKPTTEFEIQSLSPTEKTWEVGSLMAHLAQLTDPRAARGIRYSLVHLLTLLILAKLGGEDEMKGMTEWVKVRGETLVRLLQLPRQDLPHQTTYERVLEKLDAVEFERVVGDFFSSKHGSSFTLTLDGKVLRGTIPEGATQGVHLLAAYLPEQGVVAMQMEVETKANEISMAPHMLETLDLRGGVITGDAMFTQRDLCDQIVEAGGNYVFPVKANQATLQENIAQLFMPPPVSAGHRWTPLPEGFAHTTSAGHGRIHYRYLTVSSQLNDYLDWPHLGQVFRLQRVTQCQKTGRLTYQVAFGITSLSAEDATPERLMRLIRTHWHIENRLHYVRDVTFHEDACSIRQPKRQRILASLNNLVIGLIRQCRFDYAPEARRFFSVNYPQAFQLLL